MPRGRASLPVRWCVPLLLCIAPSTLVSLRAFQNARPVNIGNPSTIEDFQAGDANRKYQRADDIVGALRLGTGDWAADVGAGGGYYSMRMAEKVGPSGKVFAEDISDSSMRWLNLRVSLFKLANVEIVKGGDEDPHLPGGRLSGILIVDSYHHFTNFQAMLAKLREALQPGGRLVIADYSLAEHRTRPRAEQIKGHEIDPALVRSEAGSAGFEVIRLQDPFMEWAAGGKNWKEPRLDLWLMTAIRPN